MYTSQIILTLTTPRGGCGFFNALKLILHDFFSDFILNIRPVKFF